MPLINLSIEQHLKNCTIFGQSHSTLAIGLGLRLQLGLVLVRLGLGLCSWPNAQHVWSNVQIDQMHLAYRSDLCDIPTKLSEHGDRPISTNPNPP